MNSVTVKKEELLVRVRSNRADHHDLYVKAWEAFKRRVIEELEDMHAAARKGEIRQYVGLTAPQDHTAEYDRAIAMLEMSVDDQVTIDAQQFAELVRNEWAWFNQTRHINSTYASGGKLGGSS